MLMHAKQWDERRDLIVPGDYNTTLNFCLTHFVSLSQQAIKDHGFFSVALSGGSTPKTIYEHLCLEPFKSQIDWTKLHLFWSDERSVPPENSSSNYHMAMEAGFKNMPIPKNQIHRMQAESNIEENARMYEKTISQALQGRPLDLTMLGMGEDGHTASLFPNTDGLTVSDRLIIANHVPQLNTWRMTFTFPCINQSSHIAIYVLGASKKQMLAKVLKDAEPFPIQLVGTPTHKALWIADEAAASNLLTQKPS